MPNLATVTAKSGANQAATAVKLNNPVPAKIILDLARQVVTFFGTADSQLLGEFDLVSLGTSITIIVTGIGTTGATYSFTCS